MKEIFKDIPNYKGYYKVSNLGNIKSVPRLKKARYNYISKERILKPYKDMRGYLRVDLHKPNIRETYVISVLVAIVFLNHKPKGWDIVVDHINNNPSDNRLENLQLITQRKNCTKDKNNRYTGVSYNNKLKKYVSSIGVGSNRIYLGLFNTCDEAHNKYKEALYCVENDLDIIPTKVKFSSKYKGVYCDKQNNNWGAVVRVKDKIIRLGRSDNELECVKLVNDFLQKKLYITA